DDRGDLAVGADFDKGGSELLALGDVHGLYRVWRAHLLERDADLSAVRGVPGMQFKAHRGQPPLFRLQTGLPRSDLASHGNQRHPDTAQSKQHYGLTQSKNAMFSCASRNLGTRSYWAQCFLATRVVSSTLPPYPTCAESASPCNRNGFGPEQ